MTKRCLVGIIVSTNKSNRLSLSNYTCVYLKHDDFFVYISNQKKTNYQ